MITPILVDDREGSKDLIPLLRSRSLPVRVERMQYGDISFIGNGPDGIPTPVGIEYKQIMDVLKCITDGRFTAVQLPGLLQAYSIQWLLVEGRIRACRDTGKLQRLNLRGAWVDAGVGQRTFMYRDYIHWLQTLQNFCGIRVAHTYDNNETVAWIAAIYSWWCSKEWHEHKSLNVLHVPDISSPGRITYTKPSLIRRIAATLPGVGAEKSAAVAAYFQSLTKLWEADEADWRNIPGIGAGIAAKVWRALHL